MPVQNKMARVINIFTGFDFYFLENALEFHYGVTKTNEFR